MAQQVKSHLGLIQQEFDNLLSYGIQFFQKLMAELEKKATALTPNQSLANDHYTHNLHRSLLCLGDLSRYRELYAEKEQKDFTESVRFYERAALIVPSSGMPQNQLAMLATYNEAESTALYHYCRSIMSDNAFTGGFENIARLFAVNKSSFEQLHQQVQRPNFSEQLRSRKPDNTKFKYFLTSFVRLHGIFFAWSIRMHLEYLKATGSVSVDESHISSSQKSTSHESSTLLNQLNEIMSSSVLKGVPDDIQADQIHGMIMNVLEELDVQLHSQKLTDLHLLRLIAISIFSVHFAENPEFSSLNTANQNTSEKASGSSGSGHANTGDLSVFIHSCSMASGPEVQAHDSSSAVSNVSNPGYRSKVQSLALIAIFGLVNRVTQRLTNAESHEKNRRMYNDKILAMLSIFCEWLSQHPAYLAVANEMESQAGSSSSTAAAARGDDVTLPAFFAEFSSNSALSSVVFTSVEDTPLGRWRRKYFSGKELILMETRARSSLKGVLCLLKESLPTESQSNRHSNTNRDPSVCLLLREHAELRGYLPLGNKFESFFADFDPLRKTVQWLSEGAARIERQKTIASFVEEFLLVPAAAVAAPAAPSAITLGNPSGRRLVEVDMKGSSNTSKFTKEPSNKSAKSFEPASTNDKRSKSKVDEKEKEQVKREKKEKRGDKKNKKVGDNSSESAGKLRDKKKNRHGEDELKKAAGDDEDDVEEEAVSDEFPPLPGSLTPKAQQQESFWSYQVDESNEKSQIMLNELIEEEQEEIESEESHEGEESSFIHQPAASKAIFNAEEEGEDADDLFDDLDDVVFRPAFERVPEQTTSPFGSESAGRVSSLLNPSLHSSTESFLGAAVPSSPLKSPLMSSHAMLSHDIFSSLGVQRSPSAGRLDNLDPVTQHNTNIWEKLGLNTGSSANADPNGASSCLGFGLGSTDWGLQEPALNSKFDSWNWNQPAPMVATNTSLRGPPGLPKSTNTPPPGLGQKSVDSGAHKGFLAYLDEKRS
jgi:hypothetical protein